MAFEPDPKEALERLKVEQRLIKAALIYILDDAARDQFAADLSWLIAEREGLERAARNILPYLRWTVGPESPGHHPTMPSAVAAFQKAFDLDTPEKRTAATRRALLPTVPVEGS